MYNKLLPLFALGLVLLIVPKANGQASRTPFSTFGIGEHYGNATANSQGMAGLGISVPQYWFVNNQNPALLVYNRLTTFQAGLIGESRSIESDSAKERSTNGNLNYLIVAFPVKLGKWTTSVGLMPYTNVNYKLAYNEFISNDNNDSLYVSVTEQGSGGLSQFYWSNGVRINENITVGLKATYLFSSIRNDYSNRLVNSNQPLTYVAAVEEQSYVTDFSFDLGLAFSKDSLFRGGKYRINAGLVYGFGTDLKTRRTTVLEKRSTSGSVSDSDTLSTTQGEIHLPPSLQLGASLGYANKWTVGIEASFQDWSKFKSLNAEDEGLDKAWRISVGGEITPDAMDNNYLKRITYRTGLTLENAPFLVNGKKVKDFGINFGLSLPAGRSSVDLGLKLGQRGDKKETTLEEKYFKIYFGLTFNDQWFIKRKFD